MGIGITGSIVAAEKERAVAPSRVSVSLEDVAHS